MNLTDICRRILSICADEWKVGAKHIVSPPSGRISRSERNVLLSAIYVLRRVLKVPEQILRSELKRSHMTIYRATTRASKMMSDSNFASKVRSAVLRVMSELSGLKAAI